MSLFGGVFTKDIKQTSTTTNVDNTRVNTLTDSLNNFINQTRASNTTYNSAFDATNSFNTVMSYEIGNSSGGPSTGQGWSGPEALASLLGTPAIAKDPNANKYDFNFNAQSAGGSDFLAQVAGLVKNSWEGIAGANPATATLGVEQPKSSTFWVVVIGAAVIGVLLIMKLRKR